MNKLQTIKPKLDIPFLRELGKTSRETVARVRTRMLAPSSYKQAPVFNTAGIAELCGVEASKILYEVKKGRLPGGLKNGSRLEWSLEEALAWVRDFRKSSLRDPARSSGVVITVANFKGGVTKTTTAVTLAQGLSLRGHKVLVIDTDPQGSLTTLFGILPESDVSETQTVMPICNGDETSITSAIQGTYWSGMDIVAASTVLVGAEFILPSRQRDERKDGFEFWQVLNNSLDEAREVYDIIIIDTPPTLNYVTLNALMAADGILMPLPPNALDFASSTQFWNLFAEISEALPSARTKSFKFIDILLSRVDRADSISISVREWIREAYGSLVIPVEIPKTAIAATASAQFGTVYDIETTPAHAKTLKRAKDAYNDLVNYIEVQVAEVWASDAAALN